MLHKIGPIPEKQPNQIRYYSIIICATFYVYDLWNIRKINIKIELLSTIKNVPLWTLTWEDVKDKFEVKLSREISRVIVDNTKNGSTIDFVKTYVYY